MCRSWDSETFVSSYINIPLVLLAYFGFKFIKKSKIVSLEDMPILYVHSKTRELQGILTFGLRNFIEIAERNPEPPAKPKTGWRRFNILWE